MEKTYLQRLKNLDKFDPSEYSEETNLKGCRPIFDTPVYQKRRQQGGQETKDQCNVGAPQNQLKKEKPSPKVKNALNVFRTWASEDLNLSIWESCTLALDLNLRMPREKPNILTSQLLFLVAGKPPVLCSFFDKRKVESSTAEREIKAVESYTIYMAQQLKTFLTNFCTCDFAILRFTMDINNINKDTLQEAVKNELRFTRMFFRGTVDLTARSYTAIKKAVEALVSGSHIPCLLQEKEPDEVSILLLDTPWSDGLSLAIEALSEEDISYPPDASSKVKVAALEAATRHSYSKMVIVSSPDKDVQDIARRLKLQAVRDFEPVPNLVVKHRTREEQNMGRTTIHCESDGSGTTEDQRMDLMASVTPKTRRERVTLLPASAMEELIVISGESDQKIHRAGHNTKRQQPDGRTTRRESDSGPPRKKYRRVTTVC